MKARLIKVLSVGFLLVALAAVPVVSQSGDSVAQEVAAAKAVSQNYPSLFAQLCTPSDPNAAPLPTQGLTPGPNGGPPSRDQWYREPAKVFDNLYLLPMNDVAVWALTTSEGIILIDAAYDYSVQDVVIDGLKKLGLNPERIKHVVLTHGHGDHFGGIPRLVELFAPRVMVSATDWDEMAKNAQGMRIKRDMVATDGGKLTLGDATITTYLTPGHSPGTISLLIPVKDRGQSHLVAFWGGTRIGRQFTREALASYSASAAHFREAAEKARADVLISNHERFGEHFRKIEAMKKNPSGPNPFIVGTPSVKDYLTVVEHCGNAVRLSLGR